MNFCSRCGFRFVAPSNYCPECGSPSVKVHPEPHSSALANSPLTNGDPEAPQSKRVLEVCSHKNLQRFQSGRDFCLDCNQYVSPITGRVEKAPEIKHPPTRSQSSFSGSYRTFVFLGAFFLIVIALIFFVTQSKSKSTSYKLGYQNGLQLSAANSFFLLSGQPIDICNTVLSVGKNGTTNDGIDWQNINSDEFDAGCMDAYADTHGGLRTKSIPATSNP